MSNENVNNTTKTERVLTDEDIKAISKAVVEAFLELEKQKMEMQKEKTDDDPMTKLINFAIETMRAERELETAFRFMSLLTRRRRF